jgi:hypothetical protein
MEDAIFRINIPGWVILSVEITIIHLFSAFRNLST